jgi:MoaA/NifB/PqqE/SkfB family radical SAM enzyme
MFRTLSAPIAVQWEVTSLCDKSCIHCYNYWRDSSQAVRHEEPVLAHTYELVAQEILSNHVLSVTITGGEPLLVFER